MNINLNEHIFEYGKINKDGNLIIKKNNIFIEQICYNDKTRFCNQSCPLFGNVDKKNKVTYHLKICQQTNLIFSSFDDERE